MPRLLLAMVTISIKMGLAEIRMHPNQIGGAGGQDKQRHDEDQFHGMPPFSFKEQVFATPINAKR